MREIKPLTSIRGLFAIYVAIYHIFPRNNSFISNGYLSVDLFFILSGFIMSCVYENKFKSGVTFDGYMQFIKGRVARVYPLYLFIIAMISFLYLANNIRTPSTKEYFSLVFFLQSIFIVSNNLVSHAWSIAVEVLAYILFPFTILIIARSRKYLTPAFCIVISFAGLIVVSRYGLWGPMDVVTGPLAILRCFCGYLLGMSGFIILRDYKDKITPAGVEITLILACIISLIALNIKGMDLITILGFSLIIPALSLSNGLIAKALSAKPIVYLGEISYSIYLIHYPLCRKLAFIPAWVHKKTGLLDINIIALIMTICLSMLTYRFVEVPCRNLIKGMRLEQKILR